MRVELHPAAWPLLLLPFGAGLAAQAPDVGVLRFTQGMTEVGRESYRLGPGGLTQETVIPPLNLRVSSVTLRDSSGRFSSFSLTLSNAAGDSARGTYQVERQAGTAYLSGHLGATVQERDRPADFDLVVPPQSLVVLGALALAAAGHDTTFRALIAGADTVLPIAVRFFGDTGIVTLAGIDLRVSAAGRQRLSLIDVPSQRLRALRAETPESLPPLAGLRRPAPDYSEPESAAVTATTVRIPAGTAPDSFSLGCTLTLPRAGRPPFPALVTITGSGGQDRDENLWPLVPGYRLFRQVAEEVGAVGIATLRCDDRGIGASTGVRDSATTLDLAGDARAQIAWLRHRAGIDPSRIALAGHSEGGVIGPMIAAEDRRLRAMVILAGPAKSGLEVLLDQARWPVLTTPGLEPAERARRLLLAESAVRADSFPTNPWMRWFVRYDPRPLLGRVRQPVLVLQGALDRQVSAGQADTLGALLRSGGNRDVTVQVFPRLNHLFVVSETDGSPAEYASLRDPVVPAEVLSLLAHWLQRHLAR